MTHELSLVELESELAAELPTRNLLRRRKRQAWGWFPQASAHASNGSGANANATYQINFNPQVVINNGSVGLGGISLESHNQNTNQAIQNAVPINFGIL
jgi:hypothetical protein